MSDKQLTILIVDDSKVSRMMISSQIKALHPDWNVIEAGGGYEALELSQQNDIDYFSVDLNMPEMDGLELIERLQPNNSTKAMALLTANIQEDIIRKAMKVGAACFHKPISESVIKKMTEYFCGQIT